MFGIDKFIKTKSELMVVIDSMFLFFQNSYVKALTLSVAVFGEGASKEGQIRS